MEVCGIMLILPGNMCIESKDFIAAILFAVGIVGEEVSGDIAVGESVKGWAVGEGIAETMGGTVDGCFVGG